MVRKGEIKMFIQLNEKIIEKIEEVTFTRVNRINDFIYAEDIKSIIEDLLIAIDEKTEELDDLKQNLEDNYKPIKVEEQIGDCDII